MRCDFETTIKAQAGLKAGDRVILAYRISF